VNLRRLVLASLAAALLLPLAARADLEPLFKAAKLIYQKDGDTYTTFMSLGPNKVRRVLVIEQSLGTTGIKFVRVLSVAAQLPKGPASPVVQKILAAQTLKMPLGRAFAIEETTATFAVYQSEFFAEGASAHQLSLTVELVATLVGAVEKAVQGAAEEG
jgi:hypothetical protein